MHCGEIDSFLTIGRRAGVRVSAADADRYVAEQVTAAELVGIPRELAPASVAELADYFERTRPALRLTAAARQTARFLFLPPMPALVQLATPARVVWASAAGLAFASLPTLGPPAVRLARAADHRPRRVGDAALAAAGVRGAAGDDPPAPGVPGGDGAPRRDPGPPAVRGLAPVPWSCET